MRKSRRLPWYHRLGPATWGLLVLLLLASASLAWRTARRPAKSGERAPQVQVLNGSGRPEMAQRAARHLRAQGLDVVAIGNADSPEYRRTLVLLRRGRMRVARQVARALGVGEVTPQLDPTLLVDVTVVLGQDYEPAPDR